MLGPHLSYQWEGTLVCLQEVSILRKDCFTAPATIWKQIPGFLPIHFRQSRPEFLVEF